MMPRAPGERAARFDRATWFGYAGGATAGYLAYTIAAVAPYIGAQLGLTDAQIGLHSTAVAAGLVVAGAMVANLATGFGETRVRALALAAIVVGVLLLVPAPALAATLIAAALIGLGIGTVLGYTNATLGRPGGRLAQKRLARGGVASIVASFVGPALVAAGAASGIGWWLGVVPALGLILVLVLELRLEPPIETSMPAMEDVRRPRRPVALTTLVAAAGLLLAGAGVAVLYPLGVTAALASMPEEPARAGTRLTMANGLAVLVAPFMLGAIADVAGVATGWTTILALVAASSVLAFGLGRGSEDPAPSIN
jgi:MFS family permease